LPFAQPTGAGEDAARPLPRKFGRLRAGQDDNSFAVGNGCCGHWHVVGVVLVVMVVHRQPAGGRPAVRLLCSASSSGD
jgi:hypothetical protein